MAVKPLSNDELFQARLCGANRHYAMESEHFTF